MQMFIYTVPDSGQMSIFGRTKMDYLEDPRLISVMSTGMIVTGVIAAIALFFISAPYGRYSDSKWGCLLNARVAWFVQELPSVLVPITLILYSGIDIWKLQPNVILLCMFIVHYFQRTFIYSVLIKGGKPTPFIPFLLALIFTTYNGFLQGLFLTVHADYSIEWFTDIRFISGTILFILGMGINIHSDYILRNLRKPGETSYKIPHGGMFEFVSGANFFGEILEWFGFAVASWSYASLAFAVFTICVVGSRACDHHSWYLTKFEDYPKNRKALIPFIF